jgi:hypothetical protein
MGAAWDLQDTSFIIQQSHAFVSSASSCTPAACLCQETCLQFFFHLAPCMCSRHDVFNTVVHALMVFGEDFDALSVWME